MTTFKSTRALIIAALVFLSLPATAEQNRQVLHRTVEVEGLDIFYREAGPADAPVLLLLHGFPTSSHMFRNLMPELADRYRTIAPDYPGFGNSSIDLPP
jgi:alpha-beta hydrolase superfamily lysophospholipase